MRKILLLIAFCVCVSCSESFDVEGGESNMLDPAKGIDSQGHTSLFSGKVTDSVTGQVIVGAQVVCVEDTTYSPDELWREYTDNSGYYYYRDDVSNMFYDVELTVTANGYGPVSIVHDISYDETEAVYYMDFLLESVDSMISLSGSYQYYDMSANGTRWFKYTVPSNGTYYIYWTEGSGDIKVSAYVNGFTTTWFVNDDYSSSTSRSLNAGDVVYVKVTDDTSSGQSSYFGIRCGTS